MKSSRKHQEVSIRDSIKYACPLLSLFCLVLIGARFSDYKDSVIWQFSDLDIAQGQIIKSEIIYKSATGKGRARYSRHVRYTYAVGDKIFESSRINFLLFQNFNRREQAEKDLPQYPVGSEVKVYYRELDPKFAVLRPYDNEVFFMLCVLSCLCILFFSIFLWLLITTKKGTPQNEPTDEVDSMARLRAAKRRARGEE